MLIGLVAYNRNQAQRTAIQDLGLSIAPNSRDAWNDAEGNEIRFIARESDLVQFPQGSTIILGYLWFENPNWRDLRYVAKAKGLVLKEVTRK